MLSATAQGVLWGIMALGVYLTYRCLDFPDLTVDGSFSTGAAVSAVIITNFNNAELSLVVAVVLGMCCGAATGILNTLLKIPPILSGILTMLGLYSINIRIMGKANTSLYNTETLFAKMRQLTGFSGNVVELIVGVVFVVAIIAVLYWFFGTELGSAIRATGSNESMIKAQGVNTAFTKILALMVSNGLVALAGALVAQSLGYAAVDMGTGAIVTGLAAVIIGEVILGMRGSFAYKLFSVIFGSVIYKIAVAVVLEQGLSTTDLKLLTAAIVAVALALPVIKNTVLELRYRMSRR